MYSKHYYYTNITTNTTTINTTSTITTNTILLIFTITTTNINDITNKYALCSIAQTKTLRHAQQYPLNYT